MPETVKTTKEHRLGPVALSQAEFRRNEYVATAERGIRPQDVMNPSYWAFHAAKLKPWDHLEVLSEDGTWCGEYIVLESSRTWARIHPLRVTYLTTQDISETQAAAQSESPEVDAEVRFRGPKKWGVIRKSDSAILMEMLATRDDAEQWLQKHSGKQEETPATA